jgi:predicted metalloprotease
VLVEIGTGSNRGLLIAILFILVCLIMVAGANLYFTYEQRQLARAEQVRRQAVVDDVLKSIAELEKSRVEVFQDYIKDLSSAETTSVWHQIYHASNAQLKIQNLMVQENELLAALIAGKK